MTIMLLRNWDQFKDCVLCVIAYGLITLVLYQGIQFAWTDAPALAGVLCVAIVIPALCVMGGLVALVMTGISKCC